MPRRLIVCCCVLLILFGAGAFALPSSAPVYNISKRSFPWTLNEPWRYHPGDNPAWASPAFDDGSWVLHESGYWSVKPSDTFSFSGIGWFRYHLSIDSSLAGVPLSLSMEETQAADVYIDGELLCHFGKIAAGGKVAETYDPNGMPVVFTLAQRGEHMIAVRFADAEVQVLRGRVDSDIVTGFMATLREGNTGINEHADRSMQVTAISLFLFGFFLAFAILHLMLFLYNKTQRSNLWFSLFSFMLGFLCLLFFIEGVTHNAVLNNWLIKHTDGFIFISCISLSGFVNNLFGWGRVRYWLMYALLLLLAVSELKLFPLPGVTGWVTVLLAALETVVLIIRAMIRRVPGARILGAGVGLFTVFILAIFFINFLRHDSSFSVSGTAGLITLLVVFIAIISIPLSISAYLAWNFATISKRLKTQLGEVERLSNAALRHEAEKQHLLQSRQQELEQQVAERTASLRAEKQKSDDLLLNILPEEVAEELKQTGASAARLYDEVSVLFTDFVDFTQMSEHLSPAALVAEIDTCFKAFDGIIEKHSLEKIKTVGDAYIAVSGLPAANSDHAASVVSAALEIRDYMLERAKGHATTFGIRLGVHSGPVVAGIVGVKKFAYDIWGDTVNTAARMEQSSESGRLNISATTYALIKERFITTYRGEIEAKHKGRLGMYFVETANSTI